MVSVKAQQHLNTMDRKETEEETKATKNTKNVWKWILGVGALLMAFAFWGGYINHDENFGKAETPSATVRDSASTLNSDTTQQIHPDSINKSVRGTE